MPGAAGRQAGAEPESRQLLRRDRAGGVLHGACRAGHRLQQRPAAGRPHPLVRGHADLAPRRRRTSTRSRSTRRSRRCTTTSATACTARPSTAGGCRTSRTRSAAAARSRPGRPASCRSRSRWRPRRTRCAARPRSSPITTRRRGCSGTARRPSSSSTSSTRSASSCRACRSPAIRERMVSGLLNVDQRPGRGGGDRTRHASAAGADAEGARDRHHAGGDDVAGAVAVRAAR